MGLGEIGRGPCDGWGSRRIGTKDNESVSTVNQEKFGSVKNKSVDKQEGRYLHKTGHGETNEIRSGACCHGKAQAQQTQHEWTCDVFGSLPSLVANVRVEDGP